MKIYAATSWAARFRRWRSLWPSRSLRRLSPLAAGIVLVAGMAALRLAAPDPFWRLQSYGFDTLQRAFPRPDADRVVPGSGVVVVDIDEASLARYGQWPWSRSLVSRLVAALQEAGAKAIGLDIVFAEPDRTSPALLASAWARDQGLTVTGPPGAPLPDYDADLAATIGRSRVVTGFGLVPAPNGKAPILSSSIALMGTGAPAGVSDFAGSVPNLPMFDTAAAGQGSFTIAATGNDEVVRRLPLVMSLNGTLLPSLALDLLRVAADPDSSLRLREDRRAGGELLGYTAGVGDREIPLAGDAAIWLRYGPHPERRTMSAADVVGGADPGGLRARVGGRIVLVGTSAVGLSDLRPTPLSAFEPGVNIHAGAIEQILTGTILRRPPEAAGLEVVVAGLTGLVIAAVVTMVGVRTGALLSLLASGASAALAAWAFARADLLLDPSLVILEAMLAFVAAMLARYLVTERRANALRAAFGHYLSPHLVEALARNPDQLRLGGEDRDMTFLFTDLEGFTSFTETAEPAVLVATLNAYLDGVCSIAMEHGGTVDKIVGDAVHLMFNAPVDQPDHAARAVRCALAIDLFSFAFAARHADAHPGRPPFGITRIGVNSGRAVVGNFGGERRFDYTAHGDSINTAARLEAANKRLGTRICVSEASVEAIGAASGFHFRPIGELALKGKAQRVRVFAPLAADAPELSWSARYCDAFARLSRGEAEGATAILDLFGQYPDDAILAFHARRIGSGQTGTAVASQAA